MQKLLVLIALEDEAPLTTEKYRSFVRFTGVGKVKAAVQATKWIMELRPDLVINLGTAGSCDLSRKGLIECGIFTNRDDRFLNESIVTDSKKAILSSGDSFLTHLIPDCHLVDMEGFGIASACTILKTDFRCFKFVTDYVGYNSPEDWESKISSGDIHFMKVIDDYFQDTL